MVAGGLDAATKKQLLHDGARACCDKPFDTAELLDLLAEALAD